MLILDTTVRYKEGGVREMIQIALPMIVSNACDTVMVFTDRLFLSRLGAEQMSAAMAGGMSSFVLVIFFVGIISYSTAMIAQYYGAGRENMCGRVVFQSVLFGFAVYPVILLLSPLVRTLFVKSGISEGQLFYQVQYFDILIYGSILTLIRTSLSCFFSGIGRTSVVMFASFGTMVMNIFMNWALIFGNLGFPALGVKGAAMGTLVAGTFGISIFAFSYFRKSNVIRFGIKTSLRFSREIFAKLMRFGTPAGVEFFLGFAAFTVLVLMFHGHSPVTATAATIMFNWDHVSFVPLIGLEIAVTSLVGRYIGAGKPEIVNKVVRSGLKMGVAYSIVVAFFFIFFPYALTEFFRPDVYDPVFDEAVPLSAYMIRLASIYVLVTAQMLVFVGALRGAGDTFAAMVISVCLNWAITIITYIVLHMLGFSPKAAWTFIVALFMLFPLVLYIRYRSGKWRQINVMA